jgi:glucose-6-phosphate isomerase
VLLSLHNDKPSSTPASEELQSENLIEKLKMLDARVRRKGLESLDPGKNPLIRIGMEVDGKGRVTKNSYGVFNLAWQAQEHPEWAGAIGQELADIKKRIRQTHRVSLKFVVWAGMGGSAEDKSMYSAVGLLRRGPRVYVLDSTDPAKLKNILEDMQQRCRLPLPNVLKSTLVVAQALGMTSYEPVVNVEKLQALYARNKVDSTPNFVYMTLPNSLLDQFGRKAGYRKIELQLDNGNSTSGRHSSPMTRGSLYPLGLSSVDLERWMDSTSLADRDVQEAWRLAAFLNTQASNGRDKVTLLLPRAWAGTGIWTKQDFEESLGKREDFGLKIVIGERVKLANYRPPKDPAQDRCFLAVNVKALGNGDGRKIAALKRAGYPIAVLNLRSPELARYMQFIHYCVFGIGCLQKMNFVTQPSVELYKSITNKLHAEAVKAGGIEKTKEWIATHTAAERVRYRSAVTLCYDRLPAGVKVHGTSAPEIYASLLKCVSSDRRIEYGELTFFGDTRYGAQGRAVRKVLDRAADLVFRSMLKMPADVYEGPAMNHSFHEMVIGHGKCFSTVLISEKPEKLASADYSADYHRAQYLATQMALAERGRYVVALTLKDLEAASLDALGEFFKEVGSALKGRSRNGRARAAAI